MFVAQTHHLHAPKTRCAASTPHIHRMGSACALVVERLSAREHNLHACTPASLHARARIYYGAASLICASYACAQSCALRMRKGSVHAGACVRGRRMRVYARACAYMLADTSMHPHICVHVCACACMRKGPCMCAPVLVSVLPCLRAFIVLHARFCMRARASGYP